MVMIVGFLRISLKDEQPKVRALSAITLGCICELGGSWVSIEFEDSFRLVWQGVRLYKGKLLAAFLRAFCGIFAIVKSTTKDIYSKEIVAILEEHIFCSDKDLKDALLGLATCAFEISGVATLLCASGFVKRFFECYWSGERFFGIDILNRTASATCLLYESSGFEGIVEEVCGFLTSDVGELRGMAVCTLRKIVLCPGFFTTISGWLYRKLFDGVMKSFQDLCGGAFEEVTIDCFSSFVRSCGSSWEYYKNQVYGLIAWRLNSGSEVVRRQSALLLTCLAMPLVVLGEGRILSHFSEILFEGLNEEVPVVLGSFLDALWAILESTGMRTNGLGLSEVVSRVSPFLRNQNDTVREKALNILGRVADLVPEAVSSKEWLRICGDMISILGCDRKAIRRAAVNTFGFVAKSVGPKDIVTSLLSNLKIYERRERVCSSIAIAVIAESCYPFTVLPSLLLEYKVPDIFVQNGVLKALSFIFEYVGEISKDYIYAVVRILEDALIDRSIVHRQTASYAISHLSLGVAGLNCEAAILHLLNFVWPNIFETTAHITQAVSNALEGCRVAVGASVVLSYCLQGLFHASKAVRRIHCRIFNSLMISAQVGLLNQLYVFLR
jgi:splicing factor 3B subunit 1